MGQVFKARHRRTKCIVALKVVPEQAVDSPTAVERFRREVEAAAKLEHPNIVTSVQSLYEGSGERFPGKQNGPTVDSKQPRLLTRFP